MRGTRHYCLLVCVFALTLAGCGSDDGTIPPDQANTMLNYIEAMKDAVAAGDCERAQDNAAELLDVVNGLPNDVDQEVASELTKAADNARQLASDPDQCAGGASGETGAQPTDTTETDTTEEPTTTETEVETTTAEESTTEEEPADEEPAEEPSPEPQAPPAGGGSQGGNVQPQGPPTEGGGIEPPSGGVEPGGGKG